MLRILIDVEISNQFDIKKGWGAHFQDVPPLVPLSLNLQVNLNIKDQRNYHPDEYTHLSFLSVMPGGIPRPYLLRPFRVEFPALPKAKPVVQGPFGQFLTF